MPRLRSAVLVAGAVPRARVDAAARTTPARTVGALLGVAAALVGVRWPAALEALPTLSTLLVGVALAVALSWAGRDTLRLRLHAFDGVLLFLLVARGVSEVVNAEQLYHAPQTGFITTLIVLWLAGLAPRLVVRDLLELRTFLFWLALPAVPVAILGVLQLANVPGVLDWILQNVRAGGLEARVAAGRDDLRATSTIGHWTALGGYLAVAVSLFCAELLFARASPPHHRRVIAVVAIVVLFVGEIATLTFSTIFIAAAVVAFTFLRLRGNPVVVVALGIAAIVGWQVFGSELEGRLEQQSTASRYTDASLRWLPSTVAYRLRIWQSETMPAFLERPVTGWGQATYDFPASWPIAPSMLRWLSPESQWLSVLVRGGLVELVAFVAMLVVMVVVVWRSRAVIGDPGLALLVMLAALIATFTINSPMSTNGVPLLLWPLLGALLSARHLAPRTRPNDSGPATRDSRNLHDTNAA